jgi:hypothetical protein
MAGQLRSATALRALGFLIGLMLFVTPRDARADITGFNNGIGWTANDNGSGSPTFTSTTLTLTDGGFNEARSAFFNTPQAVDQFHATFVYQATNPGGLGLADGIMFMLQNGGTNALGNSGGGLGGSGISPSAEIEINVFAGHTIGTNFELNGANSLNYISTVPVNPASGDQILINVTYDGSKLAEKLTDLHTSQTFSTSFTVDLVGALGSTAFVGFTGGTGGGTSVQTVSSFAFATGAPVPEPGSGTLLGLGSLLLGWRCARARAGAGKSV